MDVDYLLNAVLGLNNVKNMHYFKESFKWKLFKIEFCIRSPGGRMYSPKLTKLWPLKDWCDWNIMFYWNCVLHSFRAENCQKYALFQRKLQLKVVQNWILYKKSESVYVFPPPPSPSGASLKDCYGWNVILNWNCKLHSFTAKSCQKYALFQRTSNESCSKLNFIQAVLTRHIKWKLGYKFMLYWNGKVDSL